MYCFLKFRNEAIGIDCEAVIKKSLLNEHIRNPIDLPVKRSRTGYTFKRQTVSHAEPFPEDCRQFFYAVREARKKMLGLFCLSGLDDRRAELVMDEEFALELANFYEIKTYRSDATYELNLMQGLVKEYKVVVGHDENDKPIIMGIPERFYNIKITIEGNDAPAPLARSTDDQGV